MIARIVTWAVEKRWLVLLLTVIVAAIGAVVLIWALRLVRGR